MHCSPCPSSAIVDPPRVVYRDYFHPQLVQVIHPVEVVNRHHCVPVYEHCTVVSYRDEFCPSPIGVPYAGVRSTRSQPRRQPRR
ncbi:hypothetical protein MJA45_27340 [Paenibacillus aurantius]|uniref:Spore coat protein D n=1 Tax=Paenibacillus aurantius TaxID=2918900 RepID=A0AA96LDN3_9BACL|nr:hypothetical protein [Paenibacillus aurantius]WNQ11269.1 hypothetical protein MJA45_27340 [Paenibacillus aurantius]